MRVYQYWNPGRLTFGPGALQEIRKEFTSGDRPLVVTDEGVVRAGILDTLTDFFAQAGIRHEIFDRVVADPPIEAVEDAVLFYRERGCNSVIGLGGGSSIDTAKALAVRASGEGTLKEYGSGRPLPGAIPPIFAIPTTAGTGSEVSAVAVISDHEDKMKVGIKSPLLVPRAAILDPLLLAKVTVQGGGGDRSGCAHACDRSVSLRQQPRDHRCPGPFRNQNDQGQPGKVRGKSRGRGGCRSDAPGELYGRSLLRKCGPGSCPRHCPFRRRLFPHQATVLPVRSICRSSWSSTSRPARTNSFSMADALGVDVRGLSSEEAATKAVGAVREMFARVDIPKTFSEMGIEFRLHPKMVEDILEAPVTRGNPRKAEPEQIASLLVSVSGPACEMLVLCLSTDVTTLSFRAKREISSFL